MSFLSVLDGFFYISFLPTADRWEVKINIYQYLNNETFISGPNSVTCLVVQFVLQLDNICFVCLPIVSPPKAF